MGELHRHRDSNTSHLATILPPPIKFVLSLCSPPAPSNHHNALSIQGGSWQRAQPCSGNFAQETGLSSVIVCVSRVRSLHQDAQHVAMARTQPPPLSPSNRREASFYFIHFPLLKKTERTLHNSPNTSSLSREHSGVLSDTHLTYLSRQAACFRPSASQSP